MYLLDYCQLLRLFILAIGSRLLNSSYLSLGILIRLPLVICATSVVPIRPQSTALRVVKGSSCLSTYATHDERNSDELFVGSKTFLQGVG
jgi:hypothetical protein